MAATIIQLADAIVAELNSTTFSLAFVAVRSYQPIYTLADTRTLRVVVVPRSVTYEFETRQTMRASYAIDIGLMVRPGTLDNASIDAHMQLAEEIVHHFRGKRVPLLSMRCLQAQHNPIYATEHLDEYRQYTSLVTLTYRHDEVFA